MVLGAKGTPHLDAALVRARTSGELARRAVRDLAADRLGVALGPRDGLTTVDPTLVAVALGRYGRRVEAADRLGVAALPLGALATGEVALGLEDLYGVAVRAVDAGQRAA